ARPQRVERSRDVGEILEDDVDLGVERLRERDGRHGLAAVWAPREYHDAIISIDAARSRCRACTMSRARCGMNSSSSSRSTWRIIARARTGAGTRSPLFGVSASESSPSAPESSISAGYTRWKRTPLDHSSVASASK